MKKQWIFLFIYITLLNKELLLFVGSLSCDCDTDKATTEVMYSIQGDVFATCYYV